VSTFELLPAIDLRAGRVVRLRQGDFARETVYDDDPVSVAGRFVEEGADWLHVVDLDGARAGATRQPEAIRAIVAAVGERADCEVAGGLRDEAAVDAAFGVGASRIVVGTAALRDPSFVGRLVARHGAARVAVALDVRGEQAVGEGWREGSSGVDVAEAFGRLADEGVEAFEVTAIERDGLLEGPDLALLGRLVALGRGRVIASAGIASIADLRAVRDLGCVGAIVGRAIYEGRFSVREAIEALRAGPSSSPGGPPTDR
jgi:phosphoribosylformimino-5-aminoimidazole carboxamide ribotide isomerase